MHDILKKALDEALTEQYSEQLTGCEDTEYSFSADFNARMRALIIKTDRKLIYFTKYIAAAACACVAIGCAVLLPKLIGGEPEAVISETTAAAVLDEGTDCGGAGNTTDTEMEDKADPEFSDTTESVGGGLTAKPPETEAAMTDDVTESSTVPDGDDIADTDEKEEIAEDDIPVEADDESGESVPEGNDRATETDSGATDDAADKDIADEDNGAEEEIDGDIVVEDDMDIAVEDDMEEIVEDDVVIEDDNPNTAAPEIAGNTLREIYENTAVSFGSSFENLQVYSANLGKLENGVYSKISSMNSTDNDLEFIKEFLLSYADAPRYTDEIIGEFEEGEIDMYADTFRTLGVFIGEGGSTVVRQYYDYSNRSNYNCLFGGEPDWDDEDAVEDEQEGLRIFVEIQGNGIITVNNLTSVAVGKSAVTELLEHFENTGLPENASTVGDIISFNSITAENISHGYAKIHGVYDISAGNIFIDTDEHIKELADIIHKYKDKPVEKCDENVGRYGFNGVMIEFTLKDCLTNLILSIRSDDKAYIFTESGEAYEFEADREDLKVLMDYICGCAGIDNPYYYTSAEDYLSNAGGSMDKLNDFDFILYSEKTAYLIYSDEKLEALKQLIAEEMKIVVYEPFAENAYTNAVYFSTPLWGFGINVNDYIEIYGNRFKTSDGFYEKIKKFIIENADEINTYEEGVYADSEEEAVEIDD